MFNGERGEVGIGHQISGGAGGQQEFAEEEQGLAEREARVRPAVVPHPRETACSSTRAELWILMPEHKGARQLIAQTVAKTLKAAEAALNRGELDKA